MVLSALYTSNPEITQTKKTVRTINMLLARVRIGVVVWEQPDVQSVLEHITLELKLL